MSADSDLRLLAISRRCTLAGILFVALLGASELIGRVLNNSFLICPIPDIEPSAPGTAVMLIFCACIYRLMTDASLSKNHVLVGRAIALVSAVVCICMLTHIAIIEEVRESPSVELLSGGAGLLTVPMAPNTVFDFLLISLALVFINTRVARRLHCPQWLAVVVSAIAWLSIVGYLYGEPKFYDVELFKPMALTTAVGQFILAMCIFVTPPDQGPARIFTSASEGGIFARRLLFPAIVLPVLFGYLALLGHQAQHYDATLCVALLVVLTSSSAVALIFWNSLPLAAMSRRRNIAQRKLDRSERERRQALLKAHDQAVEVAKLKSEFLANMSHEIRTPMNAVIGMADMLTLTKLDSDQKRFVTVIQNSGTALLDIIDDILTFSKIEAGRLVIKSVDFETEKLVEETAEILAARARSKNIFLMTVVSPDMPDRVSGDDHHIRQILLNLLSNAVKFTKQGHVIARATVAEKRDDDCLVRFSVSDTGIGITAEQQSKLFQPFVQADGSITRQYGGTGLGLAICKRLAELMGGEIGVESVENEGSTFWFSVPLKLVAGAQPLGGNVDLSAVKVLVVNSLAPEFELLSEYARGWGFSCSWAALEEAAEQLVEATSDGQKFDVVILDKNGAEPCSSVVVSTILKASDNCQAKAILLANLDEIGLEAQAVKDGFAACLIKPVKQSLLFDCIASLMSLGKVAVVAGEAQFEEAEQKLPGDDDGKRPVILVAEDNPINQEVVRSQLTRLGFAAKIVSTGQEAVEAFKTGAYCAILMDLHMPVLGGTQACRAIRESEQAVDGRVPIIAMTADTMDRDRERCEQAGMDDYLSKPVTLAQLKQTLSRNISQEHYGIASSAAAALAGDQSDTRSRKAQTAELFECTQLAEEYGDETAMRMLQLFLKRTPELLAALGDSVEGSDGESLRANAHELKGSCLVLQVEEMAALSKALEEAGAQKNFESAETTLEKLREKYGKLKAMIERTIGSNEASKRS